MRRPRLDLERPAACGEPWPKGGHRRNRDAPQGGSQLPVCLFHPDDHVVHREGAIEVDLDVVHADQVGVVPEPTQKTGLSVSPRSREADHMSPLSEIEQLPTLLLTIDQLIGVDGPGKDERIEHQYELQYQRELIYILPRTAAQDQISLEHCPLDRAEIVFTVDHSGGFGEGGIGVLESVPGEHADDRLGWLRA